MKHSFSRTRQVRKLKSETLETRHLLAIDPVISEFLAVNQNGIVDEDGEHEDWIEVTNPDTQPVNLSGWYLTDNDESLTKWQFPDVSLEAGESLLVFASGKDRTNPLAPLHSSFKLNGGGEFLALVKPDGRTIVHSFSPEFPPQTADVSYGLSVDREQVGFFPTPSPGASNVGEPQIDREQQLVFNEIMYHAASGNDQEEYIELYNSGAESIDLSGWRISGGVDFEFPSISIPADGYLVVSADPEVIREKYQGELAIVGPWNGRLSNSSDQLTLRNASDDRVDRVRYADEGDWSVRERGPLDHQAQGWQWSDLHDGGGRSLELIDASSSNGIGQNWGASRVDQGTPGAANSIRRSQVAPFIVDTVHSPVIPNSADTVTITSRIVQTGTPDFQVDLRWRETAEIDFRSVEMKDDGSDGDLVAGDQIYSAHVPNYPDETVVEFYVQVSAAQEVRTWPAETADEGQTTNALYQVLDSFDSNASWTPGDVPTYFEIMTTEERREFRTINRRSNAQMNATFISSTSDGLQVRYNTGVRIRGSGSRFASPPNNRINIPSDNPWQGVTAINLNQDNVSNQVAGSLLFRLAGLPAAEAKPVRMFSNGRDLFNGRFYAHVQPLNGEFADNHFPNDSNGNLYKGRRPNESPPGGLGAGLNYEGPDPEPYVSYVKLTNESQADWSDVIQLTDVLNNAPEESYIQDVETVVDIDQWLRFFAMNAVISNSEGGLVNGDRLGDDYAMYRGIDDPRFQMVPHDLDSILSRSSYSLTRMTSVRALGKLIYHPEIRPRYFQIVQETMDFLLSETAQSAIRQAMLPFGEARINAINNFLDRRAEDVANRIPSELVISRPHPTNERYFLADRPVLDLHGFAPFQTQSLTINGQVANLGNDLSWELGSSTRFGIAFGANFNYLDDGSDQGTAWRDPDFVPGPEWKIGRGEFGFGQNDERTPVEFGPDPNDKHITTYFRHEFDIAEAWRYQDFTLFSRIGDGAAIYVNGVEVDRMNLPAESNFDTPASATATNHRTFHAFSVDTSLFRDGKNVVAVEIHLASPSSEAMSFWMYGSGRYTQPQGINLTPGINSVVVEARDGLNGTGQVIASLTRDYWYDDGTVAEVAGVLPAADTTWASADGPYLVTETVTVPVGGKLTIEPGTAIYFKAGTELRIEGTLVAEGSAARRIRFTSDPTAANVPNLPAGREGLPDGPPRWGGIQFVGTQSRENRIAFADIHFAQTLSGSIGVSQSHVHLDNVGFAGTHLRMVNGIGASLILENSTFPDMFAENESPSQLGLDNISEHVKIVGRTPANGVLLIRNNRFGTNKGHNDIIDADSNRVTEGPILQILNNTFQGAGDELLDLGGDVYVAGNVFANVFKDDETSDRGYANAISTGDAGENTTIVVAKNLFYDVDHAINLKRLAGTIFENNTVVKVHGDFVDRFENPVVGSAINLFVDEPGGTPGAGAYVAGNILADTSRVFGNVDLPEGTQSYLELHNNLLGVDDSSVGTRATDVFDLGVGNFTGDPRFADAAAFDFSLLPGSAALHAHPRQNLGWLSPDVVISEIPPSVTSSNVAKLKISGPGMFGFQYKLNDGDWSEEIAIGNGFDIQGTVRTYELELANLANGEQTIEVRGRDFAGNWLEQTAVATWTVSQTDENLYINEILADNRGAYINEGTTPDVIELLNAGNSPVNLKGYSISDRADRPGRFVFVDDTIIGSGEYLLLHGDAESNLPGIHVDFGLENEGEGVFLFSPSQAIIDSVEFGNQIPNYSIGRVGATRDWRLNEPTLGDINQAARTGDPVSLRINEWLAQSSTTEDFIELYNQDSLPVSTTGLFLSDEPGGAPRMSALADLGFIEGNGFVVLTADNSTDPGHVDFRLSLDQEVLSLTDSAGTTIDTIVYFPQAVGFSQGRIPDGTSSFSFFESPTPGWSNGISTPGDFDGNDLVDVVDVDALCSAIRSQNHELSFDLTRDSLVDQKDLDYLIQRVFNTAYGDSNLDGIFNSSDLVVAFAAGEFENNVPLDSTWATGDWNCDGEFGTRDLVQAFQAGRYRNAIVVAATPRSIGAADLQTDDRLHRPEESSANQTPDPARTTRRIVNLHSNDIRRDADSRDLVFENTHDKTDWNIETMNDISEHFDF